LNDAETRVQAEVAPLHLTPIFGVTMKGSTVVARTVLEFRWLSL
jgi:hypothetical protein